MIFESDLGDLLAPAIVAGEGSDRRNERGCCFSCRRSTCRSRRCCQTCAASQKTERTCQCADHFFLFHGYSSFERMSAVLIVAPGNIKKSREIRRGGKERNREEMGAIRRKSKSDHSAE